MAPRSRAWEIQTISDYKEQNEQYWKIIEKQRAIIKSLQQSVTQLTNENEALVKKNKELEAAKSTGHLTPVFDSTHVTHQTITEVSAKKETSRRKEAYLGGTMIPISTLPIPPPRSPLRDHGSSNDKIHPLDNSRNNNQAQTLVDLPKRPPVLKLAVSNHALLHSRTTKDAVDREYLISPGKLVSGHASNPSSPHSVTSSTSTNDRPSFDSDHSSTCSTKHSASNSPCTRSETIGQKYLAHMDYPHSPIISTSGEKRSSRQNASQLMDTVTTMTKSKSEPSTPVKPRTPRYDSLMTYGAQSNFDKNMTETAILSNLSSIDVKIFNSSIQVDEKGKETYVYTIGIIQKYDSTEIWRVQKTFNDLLNLDGKLKSSSPVMTANLKKLPDKHLLSKNSPAKVDERKCMIEEYLQHAITLRAINIGGLCEFLSSDRIQSLPITLANDVGTKQGYLTKKGKNFGGWKTRYFLLDNSGVLKYYESKHGPFLGNISLANSQIASQTQLDCDHDSAYRHAFLILEPKMNGSQSKHIFCADSDEDRDLWVECLRRYTNQTYITEDIIESTFVDDGTMAIDNLVVEPSSSTESARTVASNGPPLGFKKRPSVEFIYNYFQPGSTGNRRSFSSSLANPKAKSSTTTSDAVGEYGSDENNDTTKKPKNQHNRRSFWAKKMFTSGTSNSDALAPPSPHTAAFGSVYDFRYKQSMQDYEETRGPCQVFGVSLERAVSVSRVCENYDLPAVVHRCIEYMEARDALTEEGIYRLSGSATQVKFLKKRFNAAGDVQLLEDQEIHDVHAIAGLLKMWLRELPENILTEHLLGDFLKSIHVEDERSKRFEVGRLISSLPIANYTLLRSLCAHLIRVIEHSHKNKMTLRNISIVFSATLGIPSSIFNMLLVEFDYIFWTGRCDDDENAIEDTIDNYIQQDIMPQTTHSNSLLEKPSMRQNSYGEMTRSRRNSILYQDNTPKNIISLEKQLDIVLDNECINEDGTCYSDGELEVAYFASRYDANSKSKKLPIEDSRSAI